MNWNPFQRPDFSSPGAGARSGARLGSIVGPAGTVIGGGIGALAGWISSRRERAAASNPATTMWGNNGVPSAAAASAPMGQFAGGFGAGVDPGAPDNIGDALGITDYSDRGGGGHGEGYDMRTSGSIMPTGSASMGYSAAGGGFGAGVWQGGGGTRSIQVNSGSLSPSNYGGIGGGGIAKGRGKENGVNPN